MKHVILPHARQAPGAGVQKGVRMDIETAVAVTLYTVDAIAIGAVALLLASWYYRGR